MSGIWEEGNLSAVGAIVASMQHCGPEVCG